MTITYIVAGVFMIVENTNPINFGKDSGDRTFLQSYYFVIVTLFTWSALTCGEQPARAADHWRRFPNLGSVRGFYTGSGENQPLLDIPQLYFPISEVSAVVSDNFLCVDHSVPGIRACLKL